MDSRITARALSHALGGWRTREPAYEALADGIRLLCLDNRLAPRTALPAERELAAALHVSRTTVAAAYRSLRETAHIESLRGSGSVTLPLGRREPGRIAVADDDIDLQQASPAAWPGLAGIMSEVAQDAAALVARPGYDIVGSRALRAAIAQRYCERGLETTADQVMVTSGAQSAIHLLARVLIRRGERAMIETPTYPHAAEALRGAGARLVGVPVTVEDGWDLDRAVQAFARTQSTMAYLMPGYQNPTGGCMTVHEQTVVADAAARAGATLVIDETISELAIDAEPPSVPFAGEDVVRLGSLGKTVWGGLRVGWIRADPPLIRRLVAARPQHDLGTPEFEQAVAARTLPLMPEILAQRAGLLGSGRDELCAALAAGLPEWRVPSVAGGVALWVELDAPLSSSLVLAARAQGVYLSAGSRFAVDGGHDRHLRLPFTAPAEQLHRAADVLIRCWPIVRAAAPAEHTDLLDAVV
ncbi:PLP-dependent aminotransferase family protein [Microbacterium invictum]|uniref:DNA-binding transcriptional MocR family regulator n=1 Tax=Microbacterium invictum TaxID=515415 RepID=A0AA40SMM1_9MICO|nr:MULTISPECIES: PLP-dependent aminotransferase family protein [Microbacterium]MBB4138998.1 DNA-binding transcriptional MocR family regulator [Microbacterium invictum]